LTLFEGFLSLFIDKGTYLTYIFVTKLKQIQGFFTMDAATQNKNERINLRMKSSSKRLIERAASFEGKTVSHFIMTSALEQAEKTVQKHERMTLNSKNSKIFFEALAAPVRFNHELAAALEEHDQRVVSK
jgi:uncharacterized protein (DUF1778 family)